MRKPQLLEGSASTDGGASAAGTVKGRNAGMQKPAAFLKNTTKKVPRPDNAFILYRQYWHPKVKEQLGKDCHNNDISVVVGRKWKNETEAVKSHWKAEAERRKHEHYVLHPDYVYAPRKPGEKKHRNAARKDKTKTQLVSPAAVETQYSNATPTTMQFTLPASNAGAAGTFAMHSAGLNVGTALPFNPYGSAQFTGRPGPTAQANANLMNSLIDFDALSTDLELVKMNMEDTELDMSLMSSQEIEELNTELQRIRAIHFE